MRPRFALRAVIATLVAGISLASAGSMPVHTDAASAASTATIVLSNNFIGNSWRVQMVNEFTQVATAARKQGLVGNFSVVNADNTVSGQIAELNSLILKHVSAICLDAASETALNGVIARAHQAGIPVISYDGTVTSPYAYKLTYDFTLLGQQVASYVINRLHGRGNIMIMRGVAGTNIDNEIYQAELQLAHKYPGIKVVSTLYANWDNATSQSVVARVLPNLPRVDGVLTTGGGYGVAQAFVSAHRPLPIITLGNYGSEMRWWWQQYKKNGYTTSSASTNPGVSTAAFWVAVDLLNGIKFPRELKMDFFYIAQKDLPKFKDLPFTSVAAIPYSNAWVLAHFPHTM